MQTRKRIQSLKPAKKLILIVLSCVFLASFATAETLVLPASLTTIADEAFSGNTSISEVIIPGKVAGIGCSAFAGCSALEKISIPESVIMMGENCLANCADDLLICTVPGSEACSFAKNRNIDYQAGTVYRALLIGQTYPTIPAKRLEGPANDVSVLRNCLKSFSQTPYEVTVRMNLTAAEIRESIQETFAAATDNDVSLFFYSGHGVTAGSEENHGALLGADNEDFVTPAQLRSILDGIPGRKIVIADACCSGNLLSGNEGAPQQKAVASQENAGTEATNAKVSIFTESVQADMPADEKTDSDMREDTAKTFSDAFISVFSRRNRGLAADSYFVLTAAAADEDSYEEMIGGQIMGLFSYHFMKGCGYSPSYGAGTAMPADTNSNKVLTLDELYQYTRSQLLAQGQHVQVYPASCKWFGILRK